MIDLRWFKKVIVGAVILVSSVVALAQQQPRFITSPNGDTVYLDSRGMPRLFVRANDPTNALVLTWPEANRYERKLYAIPVKVKTSVDIRSYSNDQWRTLQSRLSRLTSVLRKKMEVSSEATEINGIKLDQRLRNSLEQIRYGASEYREEMTVEAYLKKHPVTAEQYTTEFNRVMTEKYGAGFSGAIYGSLVKADPINSDAVEAVRGLFHQRMAGESRPMSEVAKGIKVLVVKGYIQTLSMDESADPESLDALVTDLKKMNIDIENITTRTGEPVHVNATLVADAVSKSMRQGNQVILLGVSKGVPELLGGLAEMNRRGAFQDPEISRGKIIGALLGSGIIGGSMVADFGAKMPYFILARYQLGKFAKTANMKVSDYRGGLKSLGRPYMSQYIESIAKDIPQNIYYLNFIGITNPHTGYASNESVLGLQKLLLTKKIFGAHGANDGLAEYPGVGTTRNLTRDSAVLAFDSDHSILPGSFDGISFRDVNNRNTGMASIFEYLIDRYKSQRTQAPPSRAAVRTERNKLTAPVGSACFGYFGA